MVLIYHTEKGKTFHDIDRVNMDKIVAYTVAWIIRRKPIILLKNVEEDKDIFLNERFCVSLIATEVLYKNDNALLTKEIMKEIDDYIDLLLYYLIYRNCDPQAIELAIRSFLTGKLTQGNNSFEVSEGTFSD